MSIASGLRYFYLAWFSHPKSERTIYRQIKRQRTSSILELGMGDCQRSIRMLQVASQGQAVRYTAIDQFEMRPEQHGAPLSLKEAHRRVRQTNAQSRLLPGDAYTVLSRLANGLGTFDLVVISAHQNDDALARAWFYVPRILHERSVVLVESPASESTASTFRVMPRNEIEALARPATIQRRAA